MALDRSQRDFIKDKIKELGSMEAVKYHYNKDCLVDRFAYRYAKRTFKRKIKRRKRK